MTTNHEKPPDQTRGTLNAEIQVQFVGELSPDVFMLVRAMHEQGFSTCHVADWCTAIELTSSQELAAIVMNLDFAQASCLDWVRTTRRYNNRAAILAITDPDNTDDRLAALEFGADDYLIRPVTIPESVERIRTLIRQRQLNLKQINQVADLTVDGINQVALRGGRRIELTNREFSLLSYLASRPDVVVSRGELLERVFESDSKSSSNVAEVYIRYLRQKIEIAGTSKLLHTFRGKGYMLGDLKKNNPAHEVHEN